MNSSRVLPLLLVLITTSTALGAQSSNCFANLPANVFTRIPVLIDTKAEDTAAVAILSAADILTQIVTERVRKALGAETGPLPAGDSALNWRQLGGAVVVTAKRDGTFTFRKDTAVSSDFMQTNGLDLLTRALTESAAGGDRVFWPETAKGDSLSFRQEFASPAVRPNGKLEPLAVRVANPAFTLPMPWFKLAEMTRKPRIDYPIKPQSGLSQGRVILDFVVDTAGKIDPSSVHEYWPEGAKRPVGQDVAYYRSFLAATTRGVATGEYKPATVGGCAINQRVRQSFDFSLANQ